MEIKLASDETLYPVGVIDRFGCVHTTTYSSSESCKWFFAVVRGDVMFPKLWDGFVKERDIKDVLVIYDNREEAMRFLREKIQFNVNSQWQFYISFGWIIRL